MGRNYDLATTLAGIKANIPDPHERLIGKIKLGRIIEYAVTRKFDILNYLGVTLK